MLMTWTGDRVKKICGLNHFLARAVGNCGIAGQKHSKTHSTVIIPLGLHNASHSFANSPDEAEYDSKAHQ